jgi:iron(III) transport system permease protein
MNSVALARPFSKHRIKTPSFRQVFIGLVALLSLVIVGLILYSMLLTLVSTFIKDSALTLAPFEKAAEARGFSTILYNTAAYTIGSLILSCALGIFLAWANERTDARIDSLSSILPILPLMVPPIGSALGYVMLFANNSGIGNIALRYIFGVKTGPISILNFYGLVTISSLSLAPVVYLIVSAALRNVDPALDEAARVFGAPPRRILWKITLPIAGPAIGSAALLVAIHAVSSFTFPFIIGTEAGITTLSVHIYRLFAIFPPQPDSAVAVSMGLLVLVYLGLFLQLKVARAASRAMVSGRNSSHSVVKLGRWRYAVRILFMAYLAAVILPVLGLAIGSLQPYLGAPPSQFSLGNFRTVLSNF